MPNILATKILSVPESEVILSGKDNVHYFRSIGNSKGKYEKMIFCIKSKEIFEEAIHEADDYEAFIKELDIGDLDASKGLTVKQAVYIIENIYRSNEEDGVYELIPSWNHALKKAISTLEKATDYSDRELINQYIKYGEYLMRTMPAVTLHKLA